MDCIQMPRCKRVGGESFSPTLKNKLRYMVGEEGESGIFPRPKGINLEHASSLLTQTRACYSMLNKHVCGTKTTGSLK